MQKCGTVIGLFSDGGIVICGEQTFQFYFGQRAMVELCGSTLLVTEDKARGDAEGWRLRRNDRIIFTTKGKNRRTVHRWAPLPKDDTLTQVRKKRKVIFSGPKWRALLMLMEDRFHPKCKFFQRKSGFWEEFQISAAA